ncbi:hypothetical protein BD779DRAFT_105415 [Infundibulicybe gibba]|nr:hypothetical protein BD779DRAFT_105415 [Infundibulicybe gibba]
MALPLQASPMLLLFWHFRITNSSIIHTSAKPQHYRIVTTHVGYDSGSRPVKFFSHKSLIVSGSCDPFDQIYSMRSDFPIVVGCPGT